ncbi:MAG: hypothetical protein VB115_14420 [Christensenellaceae bacterium]|nr:hypothetical protein [Christensenellaceae bacterium]
MSDEAKRKMAEAESVAELITAMPESMKLLVYGYFAGSEAMMRTLAQTKSA